MVERHVANVNVEGSNPFTRFSPMADIAFDRGRTGRPRPLRLLFVLVVQFGATGGTLFQEEGCEH